MLKILQARLQQYMKQELPNVQAGFRTGRETRDQIANIHWIIKKSKIIPEKHLLLLLITLKPLTVWIITNWEILKEMEIPDHLTCFLRSMEAKKQQLELDMEQQTDPKSGKEYIRLYIVILLI